VDTNLPRNGYEAARLLARLMDGETPPSEPVMIEPWGVVTRQSTDTLGCKDPVVDQAIRYIEINYAKPIGVSDVIAAVSVSRRSLERRFRDLLNRSPREEINRVRVERARALLSETELTLAEIAERCGYTYLSHLSSAFKSETGLTPSAFRKQHQLS
jgi:LacI family transcriptional regulator